MAPTDPRLRQTRNASETLAKRAEREAEAVRAARVVGVIDVRVEATGLVDHVPHRRRVRDEFIVHADAAVDTQRSDGESALQLAA